MKKSFKYYDVVVALFVATLLISNLAATKLFSVGPLILDGGAILFPLAYILGDVLTEVYGFKRARRVIWLGFGIMILAIACFTIVRYLPAAPGYVDQASFEAVLGFLPRIVLASLAAYLVGGLLNSYILARLKVKTKGKKLWLRLISSTVIGQFFDTIVFCLIAFGGVISGSDMLIYIAVGWGFKVMVEIIFLPLTYRIIALLKKSEGVDTYDKKTNFSPFRISSE